MQSDSLHMSRIELMLLVHRMVVLLVVVVAGQTQMVVKLNLPILGLAACFARAAGSTSSSRIGDRGKKGEADDCNPVLNVML